MKSGSRQRRSAIAVAVAAGVLTASSMAHAGGFAIREQSTSSQGASYAGNAAGGDLSSMFWNPAALAASQGVNTESHAAFFIGNSELQATGGTLFGTGSSSSSGDIAEEALIPSSYFGMQLSPEFWVGLATNAPFGLVTKPGDKNWDGAPISRRTKVFTFNANPNVAYQIAPGIAVGAGVQVQYMQAELKFATGTFLPAGATNPSAFFDGDDIGFGATLGIYLTPSQGTQIGLGWRSQIDHTLEGNFGIVGVNGTSSTAELTTPDIVTLSIRQAVTPTARVMGTLEWTNWSDFDQVVLTGTTLGPTLQMLTIDSNWNDAWFASIGLEVDVNEALTVRGGVAYEESPITQASERLTAVPDADRFWVSIGGTYRFDAHTTFDIAYTHVFVENENFSRATVTNPAATLTGTVETDVNLISVSMKTKLDADHPIFGAFFR